jgi:hypothetical protein
VGVVDAPRYTFLVSYDLALSGTRDYERLESRLKELGAKRVLLSQWVFSGIVEFPEFWLADLVQYIDQPTDRLLAAIGR